ncbi:MAG TPA: Imm52 family immunity protein [Rhizomicrobium sp.]|jgi:hypothetical protein|nr:Imm52 family immunity protein [Rhizomicrobium sp.]
MEVNQFVIYSQWSLREETPAGLGERVLRNLDALAAISPLFRDWIFLDLSQNAFEMTEENIQEFLFPLDEVRSRMTQMVERGVRKDDDWQPNPDRGYSLVAYCGEDHSSQAVKLTVHGGGIYPVGWRDASFETSDSIATDPAIVAYPVFKAVFLSLVESWDVDWARAFSSEMRSHWKETYLNRFDLSWMTYLSAPFARRIVPPKDALVERMKDGGLLLIAAEETFDASNSNHMAAARSIADALEPLNKSRSPA